MAILSGGLMIPSRAEEAGDPSLLSDSTPQNIQYRYFGNEGGLRLGKAFATYAEIYRRHDIVMTLITKLSYAVSRVPIHAYRNGPKAGRENAFDTPFAELMRKPNRKHSAEFFWRWTESTFELYGEAIWIKVRPSRGAPPTELWPMHPANVLTQRDADGMLWYQVYLGHPANGAPILSYPEQDVVHFRMYNPDNQVRGLSRLESLRSALEGDAAIQGSQSSFWANGARPSVLLQAPGEMSDAAFKRLRASWNATHAGVNSWGKTAILEQGVEAKMLPLNAAELQMIESLKMTRERGCSLYDVPPPVVHILDHATFSNITEQMRSMYRDTMAPRFYMFESDIATQLTPDFDPSGDTYAEFYLDEILRGDPETRMISDIRAVQAGVKMPGEIRDELNLPDGGAATRQLYANAAMVPLGTVRTPPAAVAAGNPVVEPAAESGAAPQADVLGAAPVKSVPRLCGHCEKTAESFSRRGWCRACEGAAGRRKELTA